MLLKKKKKTYTGLVGRQQYHTIDTGRAAAGVKRVVM